jgi:dihydroorotase
VPPNADDVLSKGCQIHVHTRDDELLEIYLKSVADSYGLAMTKESDLVIIYKPAKI